MKRPLSLACLLLCVTSAAAQAPQPAAKATPPAQAPNSEAATTPEGWFADMDKDKNKSLSLEEFRTGLIERERMMVFQRMQAQFQATDKNNSGFLEAVEFNTLPAVKKGGPSIPTLAASDTSKDGKLDFREYVGMVGKILSAQQR